VGDVVTATVTFSEAVTVTGIPRLGLLVGATTVQASYAGGTGTNALTFTYTILAGQTDEVNGISVDANSLALNSGTIKDIAGNNATLTHTLVADNASYLVDTTAPTATLTAGLTTTPATTSATVQSSEVGTAYLVKTGGTGAVAVSNLASITGAADAKQNSVAIATANTATSLSLAGLEDGTYTLYTVDQAGNLSGASSTSYVVDITAPSVSTIALTSATGIQNNRLNVGDVVTATVTFSEAVTVTGTPRLALLVGATTVQANYAGGTGTNALTFTYTILAGQTDANGISVAANSLALNSGTIQDIAGYNATLTHALVADNGSYLVDTTAPTATLTSNTSSNNASATVRSSEVGTAYLVKSTVAVTDLASITGAANSKQNSATIATAATNTNLSLAGLEDGTYKLYTVDQAGNLSAATTNSYTVNNGVSENDIFTGWSSPTGQNLTPHTNWNLLGYISSANQNNGVTSLTKTYSFNVPNVEVEFYIGFVEFGTWDAGEKLTIKWSGKTLQIELANNSFVASNPSEILWQSVNGSTGITSTPQSTAYHEIKIRGTTDSNGQIKIEFADNLNSAASDEAWGIDGVQAYLVNTPLVLDLNDDGIGLLGVNKGVMFDVDASGIAAPTGWVDGSDGFLVYDLNNDGVINDGSEMFGSGTQTPNATGHDGFTALQQYDGNRDGVINSDDAVFSSLQLWVDANTNGFTDSGELHSLNDYGVASIDLGAVGGNEVLNGNRLGLVSTWSDTTGQQHQMADVFFQQGTLQDILENALVKYNFSSNADAQQQELRYADVMGLQQRLAVVSADSNDTILIDGEGWIQTGSQAFSDGRVYDLWGNEGAYLLLDNQARVMQVL
jgi:hypothetical protein